MNPRLAAALAEPWMIEPATLHSLRDSDVKPSESNSEPCAVATRPGRQIEGTRGATHRDGVATIPIRGVISRHGSFWSDLFGMTTVSALASDLQSAIDAPHIRAIILECDTPGGQVTGIAELAAQIRAATDKKPVIAYVDGAANSAGYYLASACTEIVMSPMARVGSIGCMIGIPPNESGSRATITFISSDSPLKNPDPQSDAGQASYQAMVDEMATLFIADVAKYRATSKEDVRQNFGKGGMRMGADAVSAGMADRVGSYEALHRELAGGYRPAKPEAKAPSLNTQAAKAATTQPEVTMSNKAGWRQVWGLFGETGKAVAVAETKPADEATVNVADLLASVAEAKLAPVVSPEPSASERQLRIELDELKMAMAGREDSTTKLAADAADVWASAQVDLKKITPGEKAGFAESYAQAYTDDKASPRKTGKSRVALLTAPVEARQPLKLDAELLKTLPADAKVLSAHKGLESTPASEATPAGETMSADRRAFLLGLTDDGKSLLEQAKKLAK